MNSLSFLKKVNVEIFSNHWKNNISCEECSIRLTVFRKKKTCHFCKNSFCQLCIMCREDKILCCRKCQILTARPLNKNELLNLKSRDLVNYLTSRHISTNGCLEKEDLVNVLMKAVNNSCFHPSPSSHFDYASFAESYSARSSTSSSNHTSEENPEYADSLFNEDGIRIRGHDEAINTVTEPNTNETSEMTSPQTQETIQSSEVRMDEESNENDEEPNFSFANLENSETCSSASTCKNESVDSGQNFANINCSSKPLKLSDIKCSSDLNALSVKQLKELLMLHRTDFKGCIERTELLQKANRLWSDYIVSRKDLDKLSIDELCKICMDAPIECVLLECGHMATCIFCGKQLSECPICRQFVIRCVRTFKA